jgi:hypothetical protein
MKNFVHRISPYPRFSRDISEFPKVDIKNLPDRYARQNHGPLFIIIINRYLSLQEIIELFFKKDQHKVIPCSKLIESYSGFS